MKHGKDGTQICNKSCKSVSHPCDPCSIFSVFHLIPHNQLPTPNQHPFLVQFEQVHARWQTFFS